MNLILKRPLVLLAAASMLLGCIFATIVIAHPKTVDANQSEFCLSNLFGNATDTIAYITAGNSTTTLTVNNCGDAATAFDSAFLVYQVTSSSSAPRLAIRPEVSRDGVDWYPYATTSATGAIDPSFGQYLFTAAASSSDMAGSGTAAGGTLSGARWYSSLAIANTPMPYLRFKFSVPAGGPSIALFASTQVKREKLAR